MMNGCCSRREALEWNINLETTEFISIGVMAPFLEVFELISIPRKLAAV